MPVCSLTRACFAAVALAAVGSRAYGAPVAATGKLPPYVHIAPMVGDLRMRQTILLSLRINDHAPMLFMFDTGYGGGIALRQWAVDELGLAARKDEAETFGINKAELLTTDADHPLPLKLQTAELTRLEVTAETEPPEGRLAGMIGLAAVEPYDVILSFSDHLVLFDDREASAPIAPTHGFRCKLSRKGGPTVLVDIDTGAWECHLAESSAKALGARLLPNAETFYQADGRHALRRGLLRAAYLNGLPVRDVEVAAEARPRFQSAGISLLRHYVIIIHAHGGGLMAIPSPESAALCRLPGTWDVSLDGSSGHWVVDDVAKGSRAYAAGLRNGDVVLGVDGRPVGEIPAVDVPFIVRGEAGTQAVLQTRRGGVARTVRYVRAGEFDSLLPAPRKAGPKRRR